MAIQIATLLQTEDVMNIQMNVPTGDDVTDVAAGGNEIDARRRRRRREGDDQKRQTKGRPQQNEHRHLDFSYIGEEILR